MKVVLLRKGLQEEWEHLLRIRTHFCHLLLQCPIFGFLDFWSSSCPRLWHTSPRSPISPLSTPSLETNIPLWLSAASPVFASYNKVFLQGGCEMSSFPWSPPQNVSPMYPMKFSMNHVFKAISWWNPFRANVLLSFGKTKSRWGLVPLSIWETTHCSFWSAWGALWLLDFKFFMVLLA